jgi:hypothetical protein
MLTVHICQPGEHRDTMKKTKGKRRSSSRRSASRSEPPSDRSGTPQTQTQRQAAFAPDAFSLPPLASPSVGAGFPPNAFSLPPFSSGGGTTPVTRRSPHFPADAFSLPPLLPASVTGGGTAPVARPSPHFPADAFSLPPLLPSSVTGGRPPVTHTSPLARPSPRSLDEPLASAASADNDPFGLPPLPGVAGTDAPEGFSFGHMMDQDEGMYPIQCLII